MKNKLFLLILFSFTLAGCSVFYPLNTQIDEFKHSRKTTLEIGATSSEHFGSNAVSTSIVFEKCNSESGEILNAYFVLNRNSSSFKLENECFMKASGKSYQINIENQETEYKSRLESKTEATSVKDSAKVKTESKTVSNTENWYEEKFIIRFTPEMIESLKQTDELIFRFYLGPKQATFKFTNYRLQRLKKLAIM